MPDFSIYNLRSIDDYVQDYSLYAQYFANPLLPASLVAYNCCLSYFPDYTLSNTIDTYDPGLDRNIRALELPGDASFTPCQLPPGSETERPRCQGERYRGGGSDDLYPIYFEPGTSILVYPGCSVAVTVQGRVYYNISLGEYVANNSGGLPTQIDYYGDIQVIATAHENPPCYSPDAREGGGCPDYAETCICPCCPMGSPGGPESDFSFVSADGLDWKTMPWLLYSVPNTPIPSSTAYDFSCAQARWDSINPDNPFPSPPSILIYPSCINYIPEDTPVIAYPGGGTQKTLTYYLLNRSFINKDYFCCQGQLGYNENDFPYCEGIPPDPDDPCCENWIPPPDNPEAPCKCFYPVFENPTTYYRDVDLVFYYTNKSNCLSRLEISLLYGSYVADITENGYSGNGYCVGADLKVSAEVVETNVVC